MAPSFKTSLLLVPLSMMLLGFARIWHYLPLSLEMSRIIHKSFETIATARNVDYNCAHNFTIEILSVEPLIIYINNFIKETEIEHLLEQSKDQFHSSRVYNVEKMESVLDPSFRVSQSALIPRDDTVAICISQRMKTFLGNIQHIETEQFQIVKYEPNQRYRTHMDWFKKPLTTPDNHTMPHRLYNRMASTFVYLYDKCEGGETYFPEVQGISSSADGEKFSQTETGKGLLIRPKRGNAVFWNNMLPNGTGDPRVLHAGLPVKEGTKIGMNLWSNYFYDFPILGGDEKQI